MIKLKVSSNGAIYPNRGINVGMKYDNTNETIEFVLPEALETYNKYVVYSNIKGTFLAPLVDNTWTIRSNITNYPGTVKCLFLLSEAELDPNHFEIDNVATFLKVSGEFQINVANHFLKPEQVTPEEESPEFKVLFNHMMTLYNFFEEAKENDYYRGPQGPSTIAVGSTTSGLPTDNATVTNVGSEQDAILNFRIPRGMPGLTPIKGIDYNTHEDGRFLLKDQGLGAHLQYKIDGVITNNGVFPSKQAAVDAYDEMYAETEEDIGLYDHLYLANNFGNSAEPLETVVLEGVTWYNTYTWNANTYLGGTGDAIQIGSNANPIRYFEHLSASSFTNVTKIQIKLSRAAAATDATYSIYIGNTPIVEDASIPTSREEFQVYEFDAISGPLKLVFNHTQSGALYLGTLQIFATQIYEFDRAQWHWAQIQTEDDSNKYAVWVSTDENDEIQIVGINEPTKIRALVNETEQNILNALVAMLESFITDDSILYPHVLSSVPEDLTDILVNTVLFITNADDSLTIYKVVASGEDKVLSDAFVIDSSLIKETFSPTNYTPTAITTKGHFVGIDNLFDAIITGTQLVGKAKLDEGGHDIRESYGASLSTDNDDVALKIALRNKLNDVLTTLILREATTTKNGLMSSADKVKLTDLPTKAELDSDSAEVDITNLLVSTEDYTLTSSNLKTWKQGRIYGVCGIISLSLAGGKSLTNGTALTTAIPEAYRPNGNIVEHTQITYNGLRSFQLTTDGVITVYPTAIAGGATTILIHIDFVYNK